MFKKIASVILAAMMVTGTAAVAASAAETDEAVAAADESVVAAADDSAVAAADDSAVAAADDSTVGAGNKVYFEVNPNLWKNFKQVRLYMYAHDGSDFPLNSWGSKKGNMTDEGNNIWSFDFDAKGYTVDSGKQYGIIFCTDTNLQTCDIIFDTSIMGDTGYCTGDMVENNVDSNKKSYDVRWKNADSAKYGPPLCITSIGNIIGSALWEGTTKYDLFVNFLKSDGKDGLTNALSFNGKTAQQTIDEIAEAWGLSQDDVEKAIKESGKDIDWKKSDSSASSSGSSNSGSGSSSSGSGSSSSSSSGSGSSSSGSSSSSRSSGTGSVTSGEGDTLIFLFAGIMLAAAGVVFLARKRRED